MGFNVHAEGEQTLLNVSQGNIIIDADTVSGFDSDGNAVTAHDPDGYIITGTTTDYTVKVSGSHKITLMGADIQVDGCAFKIEDNNSGTVEIVIGGTNVLKSGEDYAGLQKNGSSGTLTISGTGSLTATGGLNGAGIGGGKSGIASNITISGGTIYAQGGSGGAGIGGGKNNGSNITISGGTVTANGGTSAAGIGGGNGGSASYISISGGNVIAKGGSSVTNADGGAGIGGGYNASASYIPISGGTVSATGGYWGAGIGGGAYNKGSNITISGGTVTAQGGSWGMGIGCGRNANESNNFVISGGSVKEKSGEYTNAVPIFTNGSDEVVSPKITFEMPEKLICSDMNVSREYSIIRVHSGRADILDCEYDADSGKGIFNTDKFSSYAIAYADTDNGPDKVMIAAKAIDGALDSFDPDNDTSMEDILETSRSAAGDDVTVNVDSFDIIPSTSENDGMIIVTVTVSDENGRTETVDKKLVISRLPIPEPDPVIYYPVITSGNAFTDKSMAAAGDTVNVKTDFGYDIIVTAENGQKIIQINEKGSFIMPASKIYVTAVRNETFALMSKAWSHSYVYSYDGDMNRIKVSSDSRRGVIVIDLGDKYANSAFTIYSGRKNTEKVIISGTLDKYGRFSFKTDESRNYTLVVE
ncbi:MAG: carbohydrate-binding domain-containing protein [Oscillospiraceae bacterium]|nr:carbohydrate-binding domain-containing protein [Oscillospiraceae bacterium]